MTVDEFIRNAIEEDVGEADHTSNACVPADSREQARLIVKEDGVLAGVELAEQIFLKIDPSLKMRDVMTDGSRVSAGDIGFVVVGPARSILKAERLVLNCMQRMSGIATQTAKVVDALEGTGVKVLDTRKTTPGIRFMEKWAVRLGGGVNHRLGLHDMVMIKDNHVDYAGGIAEAIRKTREYLEENRLSLIVEIEVRNLQELDQVLKTGDIDRILLDNFSFEDLREGVKRIAGKYETEASGGITIKTAREYAECGVDYISMGALTHSVKSLDLSLKAS